MTQQRGTDHHGHVVYAKTEDGRNELRTRSLALPHKLRSLLVMIDGQQTAQAMLAKLHPLGVDDDSFAELERQGLIEPVYVTDTPRIELPAPEPGEIHSIPTTVRLEPASEMAITGQNPELLRLFEVRNFYQRSIRDVIGGLGFMLQIDVENATTLEECRALRERFLFAVQRTADEVTVQKLAEQLARLLDPQ
ncbi:MAG: hypothetical protein EPO06_02965 [Burkholderiaceae bacterium]|nr:MAG: hypothetical protein EPO06_02965 [Burkholderiaceae bacterium]